MKNLKEFTEDEWRKWAHPYKKMIKKHMRAYPNDLFLIDENNNVNCEYCNNCYNCYRCFFCKGCTDCHDCENCIECENCTCCESCICCEDCNYCTRCTNVNPNRD